MSDTDVKQAAEGVSASAAGDKTAPESNRWVVFVLIAGVFFPSVAILAELTFRFCSAFFDPVPTTWHIALLALVPVSTLLTLRVYREPESRYLTAVSFLVGMSVGVALVYSVQFLPLLPIAVIGIIALGLGLLGLSPFLALASSIVCGRRLGRLRSGERRKQRAALWGGVVLAVLVLGVFILANYATTAGLRMAASKDEDRSRRGVRLIRTFGSKSALLRACYELPNSLWAGVDPMSWAENRVTREQARTVYYKVTGDSFNSVPPPRLIGPRVRRVQDFEFDSDVGGTAVNSIVRSLSMSSSRIDAVVEPDGLVAYTEWALVFANSSPSQMEARAEIALPPGGVVSRLTLWVNGEEREAAFSTRGKVRQAYQKVAVVQRRDPVLVTTCGPDRVLMQCFPVPPNGGTMKVRLGITSPLVPDSRSRAFFVLPRIVERNFGIADGARHSLLIESSREIGFVGEEGSAKLIRAALSDRELAGVKNVLSCRRSSQVGSVWTPDKLEPDEYAIVQTLVESEAPAHKNVIVVIDGSKRLAAARSEIAKALRSLPQTCRFSVIQAGEQVTKLTRMQAASPSGVKDAETKILGMNCVGGIDNREALLKACGVAFQHNDSVILWIHGPQPLTSNARTEQLLQLWERRPGSFRIVAFAAATGRNSILADLERTGAVTTVWRRGTIAADLERTFAAWKNDSQRSLIIKRKRVPLAHASGARVSSHVASLWARDEVMRICRSADGRKLEKCSSLAARYQLVTAVSGAVVLENKRQYEEAGLKAVDPGSVPTVVPEPATFAGLAAGLALLLAVRYRKRS